MQADLDLRIRQLHAAMGQMRDSDLSQIKSCVGANQTMAYCAVDFAGGATDAEIKNIVSLTLSNIACLKDHLKSWCNANNKPFRGDALIDSNRDVAIIHDLWNRDKHYDLRQSRSGMFPRIMHLGRAAALRTQAKAGSTIGMTIDPRTGQVSIYGDGKAELVIDGDVIDDKGVRIGDLTQIAERAVDAWKQALADAGITIPTNAN